MIQLTTGRRLVEHRFEAKEHVYHVPGEFVLSTSDVIQLNGLADFGQVGDATLDFASHRGIALHKAVEAFETGQDPEAVIRKHELESGFKIAEQAIQRLWFYRSWRSGRELKLAAKMEVPRVYRHEGTGRLIGGTLDMVCWIDGELYIVDLKTSHKQDGSKALGDKLKWKYQLQSYKEALEADETFWRKVHRENVINRAVLHLHPECGKVGIKGAQRGWEFHPFTEDDSFSWDAAIRIAWDKHTHGFQVQRRQKNSGSDLKAKLAASLEAEEAPIF